MNRKILNIIKFTFEKDIRNKWFIVLNIVLFLLTVIVLNYNTVSTILKENNINLSKNEINIETPHKMLSICKSLSQTASEVNILAFIRVKKAKQLVMRT